MSRVVFSLGIHVVGPLCLQCYLTLGNNSLRVFWTQTHPDIYIYIILINAWEELKRNTHFGDLLLCTVMYKSLSLLPISKPLTLNF